jgi:hypothetical protein
MSSADLTNSAIRAAVRLRRHDAGLFIVLVESHFRPLSWRVLEYSFWWILRSMGSRRAECVTLGRAQIRASLLAEYLHSLDRELNLRTVVKVGEHVASAAETANWVLFNRPLNQSMSRWYTGVHNTYYEKLLLRVERTIRAVRHRGCTHI